MESTLEELQRTNREWAELCARYRSVPDSLPVLVCRNRSDGVIEYVNASYASYFGRTPEVLIGTNFLDLIPQTERRTVLANLQTLSSALSAKENGAAPGSAAPK